MLELLELELEIGRDKDDLEGSLIRYNQCSRALDDFLNLKISFDDYLDVLSSNNVAMDEYLAVVDGNVEKVLCL